MLVIIATKKKNISTAYYFNFIKSNTVVKVLSALTAVNKNFE